MLGLLLTRVLKMSSFGCLYPPGCSGPPDEDRPDWIEEADRFLKANKTPDNEESSYIYQLIQGLREIIREELKI